MTILCSQMGRLITVMMPVLSKLVSIFNVVAIKTNRFSVCVCVRERKRNKLILKGHKNAKSKMYEANKFAKDLPFQIPIDLKMQQFRPLVFGIG